MNRIVAVMSLLVACGCVRSEYEQATKQNTSSAYRQFLTKYPQSEFAGDARHRLEARDFDEAKTKGTIAGFEDFLRRYPRSRFAQEARQQLEPLYFEEAKTKGTVAGFEGFLRRYPQSRFAQEARQQLEPLYFEEAKTKGTIAGFEDFLRRYPQSRFAQEARRQMEPLQFARARTQGTIESLEAFLKNYPGGSCASEATRMLNELKKHVREFSWTAEVTSAPEGAEVFELEDGKKVILGRTPLRVKIFTYSFFMKPGSARGVATSAFHRTIRISRDGYSYHFIVANQGKERQCLVTLDSFSLPSENSPKEAVSKVHVNFAEDK